MSIEQIILQSPQEIIIQTGAIAASFILGTVFSVIFKRFAHPKSRRLQSLLLKTKFPLLLFTFVTQCLLIPLTSLILDSETTLIQLALFVQAAIMVNSILKACVEGRYIRYFVNTTAWLLTLFHSLGLLNPTIAYLKSVNFTLGTISISLLGVIKALFATGLMLYGATAFSNYLSKLLKQKKHLQTSLQLLISKIVKSLLIVCSIFIGLSLLGIDLSVFSIFAGAIGVGVAFSLQNIFSNFFSGFIILMDRSIKPGDVISLDEGKTYGIVNKLHARYVSVRTREGKEHLIPNQQIISNKLENWSYSDSFIRMEIPFRVSYDSDLPLASELIVAVAKNTTRVAKDPTPYVRFSTLIDNAVDLKLRVWVGDPENGTSGIQSDIIIGAWKAFKEHGIRVPFPPREIHTHYSEGALEKEVELQG